MGESVRFQRTVVQRFNAIMNLSWQQFEYRLCLTSCALSAFKSVSIVESLLLI